MIHAAIVGLGRWGQTLVASVQGKSDRLRFTAAVSRDPVRVGEFAGAAPYPIAPGEMVDVVAAFEAIARAAASDRRVQDL